MVFSSNGVGTLLSFSRTQKKLDLDFIPKLIQLDHRSKCKTIKLSQENIGPQGLLIPVLLQRGKYFLSNIIVAMLRLS